MKTFSTSGTGSGQTLSEIESDKMPIYDSMADAEADLANLTEGQIVATKDTGDELSQPVDVVEEGNLHAVSSDAVAENAILKSDFNNLVFLGERGSEGQMTLSDSLSNYSLLLIGVVFSSAQNTRTFVQLMPTTILKNCNNADNAYVASIFLSASANVGIMFYYGDDTHININSISYSTSWAGGGKLVIWGIK